jgi:tRNA threonylcarbamoyladenosine biosynthesis protein TsaE
MNKSFNITDINSIAQEILRSVNSKVLLFYGELGVGKTTLISEIVKELGCDTDVSSPTFSIVNEYEVKDGLVYHFDFYRINNEEEVYDIGFEDYLSSDHWIFIEWPEKISS